MNNSSLVMNRLSRAKSLVKGTAMPTFAKKIYLDFDLFDDAALVHDEPALMELQPHISASMGRGKKHKRRGKGRKGTLPRSAMGKQTSTTRDANVMVSPLSPALTLDDATA